MDKQRGKAIHAASDEGGIAALPSRVHQAVGNGRFRHYLYVTMPLPSSMVM